MNRLLNVALLIQPRHRQSILTRWKIHEIELPLAVRVNNNI